MYAVIRRYKGMPGAADELARRHHEVVAVIRSAPGFIAYYLLKTHDGMASVTVCEEEAGAIETNRLAAAWLRDNMPALALTPPEISAGEVVIHTAR